MNTNVSKLRISIHKLLYGNIKNVKGYYYKFYSRICIVHQGQ